MFAQVQFPQLTLAEAAQRFAAETAFRFQFAPKGFVRIPLVHPALKIALAGAEEPVQGEGCIAHKPVFISFSSSRGSGTCCNCDM